MPSVPSDGSHSHNSLHIHNDDELRRDDLVKTPGPNPTSFGGTEHRIEMSTRPAGRGEIGLVNDCQYRGPSPLHEIADRRLDENGTVDVELPLSSTKTKGAALSEPTTDNLPQIRGCARHVPPIDRLEEDHEAIRRMQSTVRSHFVGQTRIPTKSDFRGSPSMEILAATNDPPEHCIVLLHNAGKEESQLTSLARNLQKKLAESAFVLVRGPHAVTEEGGGYHWRDPDLEHGERFIISTRLILETIIKDGLIDTCRFQPRNIMILGEGQGGMVALAAAASWDDVEFGGVISYSGWLPAYTKLESTSQARTRALILGFPSEDVTAVALKNTKASFESTDNEDTFRAAKPASVQNLEPLLGFIAYRFRQEEWAKQAVISFDGGGIRDYGSLLILQRLMNIIGNLEMEFADTKSSFSPCPYRTTVKTSVDLKSITATPTRNLHKSSLFLPCHYFTYAAGTSTGDECLYEYEKFGGEIFGHPRALGGLMWDKFACKRLEESVKEVTGKYEGQPNELDDIQYALDRADEDMFQCIVVAYADNMSGDEPYLFQTFSTEDQNAQKVSIWKVARATSAAPSYFPPIEIKEGKGPGTVTLLDGGFGSNNPSEAAYKVVLKKHGNQIQNMGPFISIGTGEKPLNKFVKRGSFKKVGEIVNSGVAAIHMAPRGINVHNFLQYHSHLNEEEQFPYYRFNGGEHLGILRLGEWRTHRFTQFTGRDPKSGSKTLNKIRRIVNAYLDEPGVQADLEKCAKILVDRRRLRTRNTSAWDRYASFSYYECEFKGCQKKRINTIQEFKDHVQNVHHISEHKGLE